MTRHASLRKTSSGRLRVVLRSRKWTWTDSAMIFAVLLILAGILWGSWHLWGWFIRLQCRG